MAAQALEIGGYEVLVKLSSGGMGDIFVGRQRRAHGFERLVAIKAIRPELRDAAEVRAMFLDEARLMARFQHPALTQVIDFGEQGELLYFIMEYVSGVSFHELRALRPPPLISVRAVAQACHGLHAAHELRGEGGQPLNVVHRDVSPQNLMISYQGHIKIVDFGIALMRNRITPVTEYGQIKGKPTYMAPEQLRSEPVDRRTDLFAAGIVLHELLTGRRLFTGDSAVAVALAIDQQQVTAPSTLVATLPSGLDQVVLRALQKAPADRFQSAREMADALDGIAAEHGGESLQQYAERALATQRSEHDGWLQQLQKHGAASDTDGAGRDADVATAPRRGSPGRQRSSAPLHATQATISNTEDILPVTAPMQTPVTSGRRRQRWLLLALALTGTVGIALLAFWPLVTSSHRVPALDPATVPGQHGDPLARPTTALDAATARSPWELTASARTDDATPAGVADASKGVVDAGNRRGGREGGSRRPSRPGKPGGRRHLKPPAPAAPTQTFGAVDVVAQPYAIVHLDGKQVGTTPLYGLEVPVGSHRITLVRPDTGKVRHERVVVVKEGKRFRVVAPPL